MPAMDLINVVLTVVTIVLIIVWLWVVVSCHPSMRRSSDTASLSDVDVSVMSFFAKLTARVEVTMARTKPPARYRPLPNLARSSLLAAKSRRFAERGAPKRRRYRPHATNISHFLFAGGSSQRYVIEFNGI